MLRALLLAAAEQSRAQSTSHLRYAARDEPPGHQSRALSHHDSARRGAAARLSAIG